MLGKASRSRTLGKADRNTEALGSERPGLLGPSGREHGDGWKNRHAAPPAQSSAPFKTCCAELEAKNKPRRCLLPGGAPALNQQTAFELAREEERWFAGQGGRVVRQIQETKEVKEAGFIFSENA